MCFPAPPAAACALPRVSAERLGPGERPRVPWVPSRNVLGGSEHSEVPMVLGVKYRCCNGRVTSRFVNRYPPKWSVAFLTTQILHQTRKTAPPSPKISRYSAAQRYFGSTIGTCVLHAEPR